MRYIKDKIYNCLVTNYHVISQNLINFKNTIILVLRDGREKEIIISDSKRYIKCLEPPKDITITEILDEDKINNYIKYLFLDLNYLYGYEYYENEDIFMLQHPFGQNIEYGTGKILKIKNYFF